MKAYSRSFYRQGLENAPLIRCYDNEGMDPGRFMVMLAKGWAFDSAETVPGGEGRATSHCSSFGSVKAALAQLKWVEPCVCASCQLESN